MLVVKHMIFCPPSYPVPQTALSCRGRACPARCARGSAAVAYKTWPARRGIFQRGTCARPGISDGGGTVTSRCTFGVVTAPSFKEKACWLAAQHAPPATSSQGPARCCRRGSRAPGARGRPLPPGRVGARPVSPASLHPRRPPTPAGPAPSRRAATACASRWKCTRAWARAGRPAGRTTFQTALENDDDQGSSFVQLSRRIAALG